MSETKKILLVDDEPDAIAIVEAMLSELGEFVIFTASDGLAGLEKAKAVQPDLIILDVQMPGKSGFYVFSDLRKNESTKDIPVIMLTGIAEQTGIGFSAHDMGDLLGEEPNAYLEKPIEAAALQRTAAKLLGLQAP